MEFYGTKGFISIFLLIAGLLGCPAFGAVIRIDEGFSSRLIGRDLEVFEDSSGTLPFEAVQAASFQPNPYAVAAYGYAHSAFWYRTQIDNPSPLPQTVYLELAISWIDHFSLFVFEADHWTQQHVGMLHPSAERRVDNNMPTHRIELPPHSQQVIYIRLASSDTLIFPLYLRSADAFASHVRIKEQMYGIFVGIMAVASFYGFIFFIYTFNRAYLYYLFNTISWVLMFASWDGYGRELLFHDNFWWSKNFNVLAMCLSLIWGTAFTLKILDIQKISPGVARLALIWIVIQTTLIMLVFVLPYAVMMKTSVFIAMAFPALLLMMGITAWRRRHPMAGFYLLSWSFPVAGVVLFSGMTLGLVSGTSLSVYALHFGILCQSLFLSFTLSYHLREATRSASVLKVSVEAAGVAHSALMKSDLDTEHFEMSYRYQPCELSGGDVFTCLQDPRGIYSYVLVADISGHGITATIISSAFAGALNAAIKGLQSLDLGLEDSCQKILSDVNLVMCDYFARTNHFASAVLVGIDLSKGEAVYINAGHRNIFVKQDNKVSAVLRGGSLMGFGPSAKFTALPLQLAPEDMLLLFTDGLVENDFGGSERNRIGLITRSLKEGSGTQDVIDRIWQPLAGRRSIRNPDDDMTLIVLRLKALLKAEEDLAKLRVPG